jgi:hypothetical protein
MCVGRGGYVLKWEEEDEEEIRIDIEWDYAIESAVYKSEVWQWSAAVIPQCDGDE